MYSGGPESDPRIKNRSLIDDTDRVKRFPYDFIIIFKLFVVVKSLNIKKAFL